MWPLLLSACLSPEKPGDSGGSPADYALVGAGPVLVEVGEEATLRVEQEGCDASDCGELEWSFGDGSGGSGETVQHRWATAGNHTAIADWRAPDGRRLTAALRVEVYPKALVVPPVRSGSLAVLGDGRVAVVTPEAASWAVVGEGGAEVVESCVDAQAVAVMGPESAAGGIAAAGVVAVACGEGEARFYAEEGDGWTEIGRSSFGVGSRPVAIAGREGRWWLLLAGTGELLRLEEGGAERRLVVGPDPGGLAIGNDVFVARFRSAPTGGEVWRIDSDLGHRGSLALPLHPGPDSDTVAGGLPTLIRELALTPDGAALWVPATQSNIQRGLLGSGLPLSFESTVRAVLSVVEIPVEGGDWTEDYRTRKQLDNQDRVVVAAPSPTGNYVAVAHPGTGTIQFLDRYSLDAVGSLPNVGEGLRGLAWVGDTLYVHAWLSRELSAWKVGEPGTVPQRLWVQSTVATEPLEAEVLRGKILFHTSRDTRISKDGYIACAGCHPDGDQDGLTWDFTSRGEGLRNTSSLLGRGGTDMGWLHWSANFDEPQDFENDIRNAFGGSGLLSDEDWALTMDTLGLPKAGRSADLDALAAYMESLRSTPVSPYAADATPERESAFEAAGCAECHPAPRYTDSSLDQLRLHDIGTLSAASGQRLGAPLTGLDSPTLLGAWSTAPYLHDGSAETLEQAIGRHSSAQNLSEAEIAELARFVGAL